LGSHINSLTAQIGDPIYIDDTATEVTYTTESGDAIASSSCLTITELTENCYLLDWETIGNGTTSLSYLIEAIVLGTDVLSISPSNFNSLTLQDLATAINNLDDYRITATAGKVENSSRNSKNVFLVVKVLGSDIPELKVNNTTQNHKFYIKGVVSADCVPAGYTEF
jgi:hypothetical protein